MKTESIEKRYLAPLVVSETVASENGFAASDGYFQGGGGQYVESGINDNGTI